MIVKLTLLSCWLALAYGSNTYVLRGNFTVPTPLQVIGLMLHNKKGFLLWYKLICRKNGEYFIQDSTHFALRIFLSSANICAIMQQVRLAAVQSAQSTPPLPPPPRHPPAVMIDNIFVLCCSFKF